MIARVLLALGVLVGLLGAAVFGGEVPCKGKTPQGVAWDFEALKAANDYVFSGMQDGYDYTWHLNVCKDTQKKCKSDSPDSPAAQHMENDGSCVAYLGLLSQMSVDLIGDASKPDGFALTYAGGEHAAKGERITVIKFMCDPTIDIGKPAFAGEVSLPAGAVGYTYNFVWHTKYGCTEDQRGGGCGAFCIIWFLCELFMFLFDILILPVIIAYFVIFAIINKFLLHKSGTDIIPQFKLWKNLPMLVFEGVKWPIVGLVTLIKSKTSKGKYSQMS